jgi:thiol-disulfide isomerase/thioredoxin
MISTDRGRSCPAIFTDATRGGLDAAQSRWHRRPFPGLLSILFALLLPATTRACEFGPPPAAASAALPSIGGETLAVAPTPGRTTIIHFFATWCESCRDELSALDLLHASDDGPRVIAISVGEPPVRVRRFFEGSPVRYPVLLDEARSAMKAWDIGLFPTSIVIGPDGQSCWREDGVVDWQDPDVMRRLADAGDLGAAWHAP